MQSPLVWDGADVSTQSVKLQNGAVCSSKPRYSWWEERQTQEADCNYLNWNLARSPQLAILLFFKSATKCDCALSFTTHQKDGSNHGGKLVYFYESCKMLNRQKCIGSLNKSYILVISGIFTPNFAFSSFFCFFYCDQHFSLYNIYIFEYICTHTDKTPYMHR